MKVIHLISGGDTGGAKTHVHSLLQHLSNEIDVTMVCFTEGVFAEEARQLGIHTIILPGNHILRTLRKLETLIKKENYDLIHCHGSRGNMMAALLSFKLHIPTVSTIHSDYRLDYLGRPLSRFTYGFINTFSLRLLDYHIGVSHATTDLLIERGFQPNRLFTIYNGLSFEEHLSCQPRQIFLNKVGLQADDDSVIVGIAARLNPVKDIPTLIKAFAKAYAENPDLRLLIAGDGEEKNNLQNLITELNISHVACLAGWIEDTNAFYDAIDINALTSLSETFPYALTEGARAALPTVSSNVGGIPYLIEHGVTGFLFPVSDNDALAKYLLRLSQSKELRTQIGNRLYEKAKRDFSLQATITRQLDIYQKILSTKKQTNIVICGAYGKGNAGDDAILKSILSELRELDDQFSFHVLSRNPKETRLIYNINAIYTFDFLRVKRLFHHSTLYINGGGSLMQDITSRRSLWFYLWTLYAAKKSDCHVLMYGCGIGPIQSQFNRKLASRIIETYVDAITLRDPHSMNELESMQIHSPEIVLSSDPTVILPAASEEVIDELFREHDLNPQGDYIAIILRPWELFDEKVPTLARSATYAYEKHGLLPIFFPIEPDIDIKAAKKVSQLLDIPHVVMPGIKDTSKLIGFLSRMSVVVSMRLHGLIFSAGQGVPLVGIVYDPKVSSFLSYINQNLFIDFSILTEPALNELIDAAISHHNDQTFLSERVKTLREAELKNQTMVKKLLSLS